MRGVAGHLLAAEPVTSGARRFLFGRPEVSLENSEKGLSEMNSTNISTSSGTIAPTGHLGRAMASTRAVLSMAGPGHLDAPTPCASWDVRALVGHIVSAADWVTAGVNGTAQPAVGDYADGNLLARYDENAARILAAFETEGVLERTITLPFGERSGAALLNLVAGDRPTGSLPRWTTCEIRTGFIRRMASS
ncbi:MAG TPA: maleylpyruvate isomerase N-terminal domain-containing protein [Actinocrinis sp.]|nr:maleylpyruvate isomerase N-terminal domain-containing protein [Actinocrinis sp.]